MAVLVGQPDVENRHRVDVADREHALGHVVGSAVVGHVDLEGSDLDRVLIGSASTREEDWVAGVDDRGGWDERE